MLCIYYTKNIIWNIVKIVLFLFFIILLSVEIYNSSSPCNGTPTVDIPTENSKGDKSGDHAGRSVEPLISRSP